MAIWSPVTWLHTAQVQDDYLFYNTIRQVCSDTQLDFAAMITGFLQRDKEHMNFILGEKKRIFSLNELEHRI